MPFIDDLVDRLPGPIHGLAKRYHELIKFTRRRHDVRRRHGHLLRPDPDDPGAQTGDRQDHLGVPATILSYVLNREWAFKNRGGRERHHEALLFFVISGMGVAFAGRAAVVRQQCVQPPANVATLQLAVVDFVLGFIIGNLLQMGFRFWALRKFAFPEADFAILDEDDRSRAPAPGNPTTRSQTTSSTAANSAVANSAVTSSAMGNSAAREVRPVINLTIVAGPGRDDDREHRRTT